MAITHLEKSQYHLFLESEFINNLTKLKKMSTNLNPSIIQDYLALEKTVAKNTLNLIELGTDYDLTEESVNIFINGEIYEVNISSLRDAYGESYINNFFEKNSPTNVPVGDIVDNSTVTAIKNFVDIFSKNKTKESEPVTKNKDITSSIFENVANIQRLVVSLEKEKDDALSQSIFYKDQFSALRDKTQDLTALLEQKDVSPEEYNQLKDVADALRAKNIELEDAIVAVRNELAEKVASSGEYLDQIANLDNELLSLNEYVNKLKESLSAKELEISSGKEVSEKFLAELNKEKEHSANQSSEIKRLNGIIENKNGELSSLRESLKEEQEKGDSVRIELSNKITELTEKVRPLEEKVSALENEKLKIKEELEPKVNSLTDINNNLKSELELLKGNKIKLESIIDKLNEEKDSLSKNLKGKETEVSDNYKCMQEFKENFEAVSEQVKDLENKLTEKDNIIKSLQDDLQKALNEPKIDESVVSENNELKKRIEKLNSLAYVDVKTNLKNTNSFNKEFPKVNKDSIVAAICGIRGLKNINESKGRKIGDNCIIRVSQAITKQFPNSEIYRIIGDQFVIITKDKTANQIKGDLVDLQLLLNHEDIDISYGVCDGKEASSNADIINKAEQEMFLMKKTANDNSSADTDFKLLRQAVSPNVVVEEVDNENRPQSLSEDELLAQFINQ